MALGYKRYYCSYTSDNGTLYDLEIYDSDAASGITATEIDISSDGVILTYEGEQRDSSILGSSLSFDYIITDSDLESFITDIGTSPETRFAIKLLRNSSLEWFGYVLPDLLDIEDAPYPFLTNIKATDCIGRLKSIDYTDASGNLYTGSERLLRIIADILYIKSGIGDVFGDDDDLVFLNVLTNWYDKKHDTGASYEPLNYTKVNQNNFLTIDEGIIKPWTCFEVISEILNTFNARLYMSNGRFYIEQINDIDNTALYVRTFEYEAGLIDSELNTAKEIDISQFNRLQGGVFKFLPSLKKVITTYKYRQQVSSIILRHQDKYPDYVNIGEISTGVFNLQVIGNVVQTYSDPGLHSIEFATIFKLFIKVVPSIGNPYYLNNPTNGIGSAVWTQSATEKWVTLNGAFENDNEWTIYTPVFNFLSPEVGSTIIGTVYYKFEFWKHINRFQQTITLPSGSEWDYYCGWNFACFLIGEGSQLEGEYTYQCLNNSVVGLSEDVELAETTLGTGPDSTYVGNLTTASGEGTYASSTTWKCLGDVDTNRNINYMRCEEYVLGQTTPTKKYLGSFKSIVKNVHLLAHNWFTLNGLNYAMLNMEIITARDITQGEWVSIQVDRSGKGGDMVSSSSYASRTVIDQADTLTKKYDPNLMWYFQKIMVAYTSESLASGVSVTGIQINESQKDITISDALVVYDPYSDYSIDIVAGASASIGATSIEISSVTPENDIPSGAFIFKF